MCGVSNPTGGRLCLGMIASNNDGLHSAGCKYGPSFVGGDISYCLGECSECVMHSLCECTDCVMHSLCDALAV
jgi:hypothetical protein